MLSYCSARSSPFRRIRTQSMRITILMILLIPTFPGASADMFGFFKKYTVHLSPEVHGRITLNNQPLTGIPVFRELHYEKNFVDQTVTDENGSFYFPARTVRSNSPGKLFGETHVNQTITADYQEEVHILWRTATTNIEGPKVLAEKLATLECDLSTPLELIHIPTFERPEFTHNIRTKCRWIDAPV